VEPNIPCLVDPAWLVKNLDKVVLFDASYDSIGPFQKDIHKDYEQARIPGAIFYDINQIYHTIIKDPKENKDDDIIRVKKRPSITGIPISASRPSLLPDKPGFEAQMRKWNLSNNDHIVVYDTGKEFVGSARVWWTFRLFGHGKVSVLEGGLERWLTEGGAIASGPYTPTTRVIDAPFEAKPRLGLLRTREQLLKNLNRKKKEWKKDREIVIDVRSPGRYMAYFQEPLAGLRSGHIPLSLNIPYTSVLHEDTGKLKDVDELTHIFTKAGVDFTKSSPKFVTMCFNGVQACVINLALFKMGFKGSSVYDAGWADWGLPKSMTPIWKGTNEPVELVFKTPSAPLSIVQQ